MNLDALYREVVLDHHRNPRGRRELSHVDAHGHGLNPSCGDEVTVELRLDGGRIADVAVRGHGCAISTASGSILAELLEGRGVDEAQAVAAAFVAMMHGDDPPDGLELGDLEALTGVQQFPVRIKCALLPWITLQQALDGDGGAAASTEEPA